MFFLVALERGCELGLAPGAHDPENLGAVRLLLPPDGLRQLRRLETREVSVDALLRAAVRPHQAHQQLQEAGPIQDCSESVVVTFPVSRCQSPSYLLERLLERGGGGDILLQGAAEEGAVGAADGDEVVRRGGARGLDEHPRVPVVASPLQGLPHQLRAPLRRVRRQKEHRSLTEITGRNARNIDCHPY